MNDAISKILESSKPAVIRDPNPDNSSQPHAFKAGKDKNGLALEGAVYIKSSCKHCYGRGVISYVPGDGYITVAGVKEKTRWRDRVTCACVHQNYAKTRLKFEREVKALVAAGKEEAAAKATVILSYANFTS